MKLFLDNDAFKKLAFWDVLADGVRASGSQLADVRYLKTAPYWFGLLGKKRIQYPEEVERRLREVLDHGKSCALSVADTDAGLTAVADIDAGEAVLLLSAAN